MASSLKIVRTLDVLRQSTTKWRDNGKTIALVPTMGALHAGHMSLVTLAKKKADRAVVSIFVNPTQFAANEDLSRYPRDEAGDLAKLAHAGADLVWSPGVEVMYPDGFSTGVQPGNAAQGLEGAIRPTHFAGVTTVCCKLFNQVMPDIAIFGEKDYQQLTVLRQMVRDLDMPLKLVAAKTKREKNGLALSSRNAYLSADERQIAPALYAVISELAKLIGDGANIASSVANAKRDLIKAGFANIDYIEVRDAATLEVVHKLENRRVRVLAAARLGQTRLIDNVAV